LIEETGFLVDRMSVNIELPSSNSLKLLAPQKSKESIIRPMGLITNHIAEKKEARKYFKKAPQFVPAGQSTQLIIGATPEKDLSILKLSENLYNRFHLKRVYFSAYVPVSNHPNLPAIMKPPLLREHRLYQADWLLRFYGFKADELLNTENPDFSTDYDPKSDWAIRNLQYFPVEINRADYQMLLRVPGIGIRSAQRITAARRSTSLNYDSLKKLGVVLKRARYFITCQGKYFGGFGVNENVIRSGLLLGSPKRIIQDSRYEQISMFSPIVQANSLETALSTITGEL
jgi:putative DNA modification/repair radical SAM protein